VVSCAAAFTQQVNCNKKINLIHLLFFLFIIVSISVNILHPQQM